MRVLLVGLIIFILFPFVFAWVTGGSPLVGPSKYWQGQLITFFILAVFAMSYDLVLGYSGILSFGHAAFFGGGAYAMAIFYKHVVPGWLASGKFHIQIGSLDLTQAALFIIALADCVRGGDPDRIAVYRGFGARERCLFCHDHAGNGSMRFICWLKPPILSNGPGQMKGCMAFHFRIG